MIHSKRARMCLINEGKQKLKQKRHFILMFCTVQKIIIKMRIVYTQSACWMYVDAF